MKTLSDLIMSYLAGRAKTRLYGVFTIWILLLHIDVIFAALFLDQKLIFEKTHLLKNEYIQHRFFTFDTWWALPLVEGVKIVVAVGATYLMIWILPKHLLSRAYRQEIRDEYDRKKDKLIKENELEQERLSIVDMQLKTVKKEVDAATQREHLSKAEEAAWEDDYDEFRKHSIFPQFNQLYESLYTYNGKSSVADAFGGTRFKLPKELVAFIDTNGLAEINNGNVRLTQKGKYFMKKYVNESKLS